MPWLLLLLLPLLTTALASAQPVPRVRWSAVLSSGRLPAGQARWLDAGMGERSEGGPPVLIAKECGAAPRVWVERDDNHRAGSGCHALTPTSACLAWVPIGVPANDPHWVFEGARGGVRAQLRAREGITAAAPVDAPIRLLWRLEAVGVRIAPATLNAAHALAMASRAPANVTLADALAVVRTDPTLSSEVYPPLAPDVRWGDTQATPPVALQRACLGGQNTAV